MQQIQSASLRLADAVEAEVLALWARVEAGDLTETRFRAEAAASIAAANAAGVSLADIGLSAEVTRQLRIPSNPVGLLPTPPQSDQSRIAANLAGVLTERPEGASTDDLLAESRRARLGALARSEPLMTVATAVQAGMVAHAARGWTRGLNSGACKVCQGWADGVVRSTGTHMARHPGCGCIQMPAF